MHWRRKWQPTPVFLPGESQGWGAWWAAVYRVTQSQTRLKQLSSSSSRDQSKTVITSSSGVWAMKYMLVLLRRVSSNHLSWNWLNQKRLEKQRLKGMREIKRLFYPSWVQDTYYTCKRCYQVDRSWKRQWHPTPVLLPGKSHGRRSLVGCSPWCR